MSTSIDITPSLRRVAGVTLLGILLVLAVRLTMTEVLRQTIGQKTSWLNAVAQGKAGELPKIVGPAVTVGFACLTALLAAGTGACAAVRGGGGRLRFVRFVLVAAIIALAVIAAFRAADRFAAIVGAADLATALLAGWAVGVLCQKDLLGDAGRKIVIMALLAILAAWTFKGLYTRFVEMPDTIADYYKDKPKQLRQLGINPDDPYAVKIFESRLLGMEISGFISYSNVMGEAMIGLVALLGGLLAARFIPPAALALPPPERQKSKRAIPEKSSGEIPVSAVLTILGGVLLGAAVVTSILTRSRGGSILAIACVVAIGAAPLCWRKIIARRRTILIAGAAAAAVCVAGIVGYGLARHSLIVKSLTFRWQYWTASVQMIREHPVSGVGLNNFGGYYTAFKSPSAPEDVTDPHSFFVRIAAEAGIPAALLVAVLILWQIISATRRGDADAPRPCLQGWPLFLSAVALCSLWWIVHFFLADTNDLYSILLLPLYIALSAGAAWLAGELLGNLSPFGIRVVCVAGLTGAVGMFAYDQIDLGLFTGPVAMLFWVLLNVADSYTPLRDFRGLRPVSWIPAAACFTAAVALGAGIWIPLLNHAMAWDPAPYEFRYIDAAQHGNLGAALAAIDQAIARDPRLIELRLQRIFVEEKLHQSTAADVRYILSDLDRANAPIRVTLGMRDSDLPPGERAAILRQALQFNNDLPPDEPKRLPADEVDRIRQMIEALEAGREE